MLNQCGYSNLVSKQEDFTLEEFLDNCKTDRMLYASVHERLLKAIGEPTLVDTSRDPRLSRIFQNRTIKTYGAFKNFFGMEETIEKIVDFLEHAKQGLEASKQVLYLMGPVGGGKSSLAEQLKALVEVNPIYVLAIKDPEKNSFTLSPTFEHPFGLFDPDKDADFIEKHYNVSRRYLRCPPSPWAVKRLVQDLDGDISKFHVVKIFPTALKQIGVCKTEPGDENNQDISALVGKVDLRKLEMFSQDDVDAYSFSGGLCRANQGLLEFVEMFKAPIKVLNPLLTATQEKNYKGTEGLGAIPFEGMVLAHSNEAEWDQFRNNKYNEAFINRVTVVDVPYCTRYTEEVEIYKKLLDNSDLGDAPCAPETLELLAKYSVLTRLVEPKNSNLYSKLHVYNGEVLKDKDPKAKSYQEYKDSAGPREGMSGFPTRDAYKVVSKLFNFDTQEKGANPVHLFSILEESIRQTHCQEGGELTAKGKSLMELITDHLKPTYLDSLGKEIHVAYLEAYAEYGQNRFDHYIRFAEFWIDDEEYRDAETNHIFDRQALDEELQKIEKPAGITNPKDFRNEVVNFCRRHQAKNNGANPEWTSYEKLREVIEKSVFKNMEEMIPIISFAAKENAEDNKKHNDFLERMTKRGYTPRQVRILVEWYIRIQKT